MKEDIIREPVELIDEDLDVVAGGLVIIASEINAADIDQSIRQFARGVANSQVAANAAVVSQSS